MAMGKRNHGQVDDIIAKRTKTAKNKGALEPDADDAANAKGKTNKVPGHKGDVTNRTFGNKKG